MTQEKVQSHSSTVCLNNGPYNERRDGAKSEDTVDANRISFLKSRVFK